MTPHDIFREIDLDPNFRAKFSQPRAVNAKEELTLCNRQLKETVRCALTSLSARSRLDAVLPDSRDEVDKIIERILDASELHIQPWFGSDEMPMQAFVSACTSTSQTTLLAIERAIREGIDVLQVRREIDEGTALEFVPGLFTVTGRVLDMSALSPVACVVSRQYDAYSRIFNLLDAHTGDLAELLACLERTRVQYTGIDKAMLGTVGDSVFAGVRLTNLAATLVRMSTVVRDKMQTRLPSGAIALVVKDYYRPPLDRDENLARMKSNQVALADLDDLLYKGFLHTLGMDISAMTNEFTAQLGVANRAAANAEGLSAYANARILLQKYIGKIDDVAKSDHLFANGANDPGMPGAVGRLLAADTKARKAEDAMRFFASDKFYPEIARAFNNRLYFILKRLTGY